MLHPTSNYVAYNRELRVTRPDTFEPKIADIFRALPKINRFNGQTNRPYSVASHCLVCEQVASELYGVTDPHLRLAVLLHDASEAYVGDIVRPIKHFFTGFSELEYNLFDSILDCIGLTGAEINEIHDIRFQKLLCEIDTRVACNEADHLTLVKILPHVKRLPIKFFDMTPNWQAVEVNFISAYNLIVHERNELRRRNNED